MTTTAWRREEIGLGRIKRLASSGLPLEPLVRSVWEIMSEALPHSPHMGFIPYPGELSSPYLVSDSEAYNLLPAFQHYFSESAQRGSPYKVAYTQENLARLFLRKTIWTLQDLAVSNFYRTEGYNEVFGPLGWYDGAQISLREDGIAIGHYPIWHGRNRRSFDREDLKFLESIAPPITHALKVAKRFTPSGQEPTDGFALSGGFAPLGLWGRGVILLDRLGRLVALDNPARAIFQQLAKFDGVHADAFAQSPVSDGLAYIVKIVNSTFRLADDSAAMLPTPVVRFYSHWTGTMLRLRGVLLTGADGRQYINVLVETGESAESRRKRVVYRWGLTEREAQVLDFVAEGKTNPEIAIILGVSRLTVKKHLEHIFQALGVETRTAATVTLQSKGG